MLTKLLKSAVESTFMEYPARSLVKTFSRNSSVVTNQSMIMIFLKCIHRKTNCIDIGASKGSIFKHMVRLAPQGIHYAFEPVPDSFAALSKKFSHLPDIHLEQMALSNKDGKTKFNIIQNHPGYSGLQLTAFPRHKEVKEIDVELRRLDSVLPPDFVPGLIKVDVEGNEYFVFEGAYETLKKNNPVIVFEHGKEMCAAYGIDCSQVYDILVSKLNYKLYTLNSFLGRKNPLTAGDMKKIFDEGLGENYVAAR